MWLYDHILVTPTCYTRVVTVMVLYSRHSQATLLKTVCEQLFPIGQ